MSHYTIAVYNALCIVAILAPSAYNTVMPIPPLNENGLLPEGLYDATFAEIKAAFGHYGRTGQRNQLCEHLERFLVDAKTSLLISAVIVDGSFVTLKEEPGDIDLVVVTTEEYTAETTIKPFEYNLLSKRRVHRLYGFDVAIVKNGSDEYRAAIEFFSQVRSSEIRKGMVKVIL